VKLISVDIEDYRSIKEKLTLHTDGLITILIGANDTGKTNLLNAIQRLNDDAAFSASDRNWDLPEAFVPTIKWSFKLTPTDRGHLAAKAEEMLKKEGRKITSVTDDAEQQAFEVTEIQSSSPPPESPSESHNAMQGSVMAQASSVTKISFPNEVQFARSIDSKVEFIRPKGGYGYAELGREFEDAILALRPRVELFTAAEQLMDVITLAQLQEEQQEFMQGIFIYADIWEDRQHLFQQTPATDRRLERASQTFTDKIRKEWQQGEDLSFRLSHSGQNGDHIQLYILDPAVKERYVQPSERSEGFSAFFKMNMRLRARTAKRPASSYIFLFDEPGTALHPAGQVNLMRVFETLSKDNQIIYATHSLFMINHNRPQRNRVVSKGQQGTKVDQKPFLKNWRAVRESLGLILAGTFFIADRTLLVEGESDALYIGALLAACDRAGLVDVDLNIFSVQWAGNARDFSPMARLLLEEGREVVALVDGDSGGKRLKDAIDRLNAQIEADNSSLKSVVVIELLQNESIENILPGRNEFFRAVVDSRRELVSRGFREAATGPADDKVALEQLKAYPDDRTLGRFVDETTPAWFQEPEPISKLMIARNYVGWLEVQDDVKKLGMTELAEPLRKIVETLGLGSKESDRAVFEKAE
jgi:predicted ATP-dependent endonuclease of OLD family